MKQANIDQIFERAKTSPITLDNKPANVSGRLCKYATIWTQNNISGVQFSWQAVERIVSNGGNFRS